jgi:hypothetical protein
VSKTVEKVHGMQYLFFLLERKELEPNGQTDEDQETRGLEGNPFTREQDECEGREK